MVLSLILYAGVALLCVAYAAMFVALFGGFADYLYLAPDALATKISNSLPAEAAALIGSVMANGFQWAVRRGGVKIGDTIRRRRD